MAKNMHVDFSKIDLKNVQMDETTRKAYAAVRKRKMTTIITVIVLVLIGVVTISYSTIISQTEENITNQYLIIDNEYSDENLAAEAKKVVEKNKNEEIVPDHSKTLAKFIDFAQKYPKHNLGMQAILKASNELIRTKQYDKAIEIINNNLILSGNNIILQIKLRSVLASLYAEKQNIPKALEQLNILEHLENNPMKNNNLLFKAQVLFLSGNKIESKNVLDQIIASSTSGEDLINNIKEEALMWKNFWKL